MDYAITIALADFRDIMHPSTIFEPNLKTDEGQSDSDDYDIDIDDIDIDDIDIEDIEDYDLFIW